MLALVAGCGGGGGGETTSTQTQGQRVVGPGFTFSAPASWKVSHDARSATVKPGGDEPTLASVTALTLRSKYTPRLYAKVAKELDTVTSSLADKLNGKVIARRESSRPASARGSTTSRTRRTARASSTESPSS